MQELKKKLPQPSLFDIAPASRRDKTSQEAGERVKDHAETIRGKVLELARARGEYGITGREATDFVGGSPWTVRPRLTELKDAGYLVKTKRRRENQYVFVLTRCA